MDSASPRMLPPEICVCVLEGWWWGGGDRCQWSGVHRNDQSFAVHLIFFTRLPLFWHGWRHETRHAVDKVGKTNRIILSTITPTLTPSTSVVLRLPVVRIIASYSWLVSRPRSHHALSLGRDLCLKYFCEQKVSLAAFATLSRTRAWWMIRKRMSVMTAPNVVKQHTQAAQVVGYNSMATSTSVLTVMWRLLVQAVCIVLCNTSSHHGPWAVSTIRLTCWQMAVLLFGLLLDGICYQHVLTRKAWRRARWSCTGGVTIALFVTGSTGDWPERWISMNHTDVSCWYIDTFLIWKGWLEIKSVLIDYGQSQQCFLL